MISLDEIVNEHYDELNENDLYIWQYILHHKEECQKMSIQELSYACNVSHTSIIRFTKKIGLDGYSELKVCLKWDLKKKLHFNHHVMNDVSDELKQTLVYMQNTDLDNILKLIDESRCIFVVASGEVQRNTAQELKREFAYMKKIFYVIEGETELDTVLRNVSKDDAFILISLSGDNETIVTLAKVLKTMKIPIIGIAKGNKNLLSSYVDEYISFASTHFDIGFQGRSYCCMGHFFLIVNMLFLRYLEYCSMKDNI